MIAAQCHRAAGWIEIGEGFVDHQPAATLPQQRSNTRKSSVVDQASVRVVGIDDHRMAGMIGKMIRYRKRDDLMAGAAPGGRVFAVGRTDDGDRTGACETRQPRDQRLAAGGGGDLGAARQAVSATRRSDQRILVGARGQPLPQHVWQGRGNWPGAGIDSGRKVEPHLWRTAILRQRLGQISTMLHAQLMPLSAAKRERLRKWLAVVTVGFSTIGFEIAADAAELPRVASINLCTDQLLMTLADPEQILGLSPYARDPARSWDVVKASQFSRLSGEAEDVLVLGPDIVVAGRYTKRATRELLREKGLRVVEFDPARSLDDAKKQLRQMGELVGHPDRALAEIKRLDAAIARLREVAFGKSYRVLAVSRRGWVSGGESLTTSLLSAAGLTNAGGELGLKGGGYASLEAIVALKPDFILVSDSGGFAEDEGRAFLLHPALERLYPDEKRIVIPERLTICGGPMLSEALDRLAAELQRVALGPRPAASQPEPVNH